MADHITISRQSAEQALTALVNAMTSSHQDQLLDGRPSFRGAWVEAWNHWTPPYLEIAHALGRNGSHCLSTEGEPSPERLQRAHDLAQLLMQFWADGNRRHIEQSDHVPPCDCAAMAEAIACILYIPAATARGVMSTAARAMDLQLSSVTDWQAWVARQEVTD